ncbi:thiamine phosphate synthase [Lysinibacillus contaminans]|uniref:thiamine phosphate synthase n=1 Tax=Lysinibacillus contaminans TaxID=1293441 RepID=UPI0006AFB0C4|nr:thiamine phosphate synthase [Lysinibacillus contaminans]
MKLIAVIDDSHTVFEMASENSSFRLITNGPNTLFPSHSLPVKEVRTTYLHLRIDRSLHIFAEVKLAEADGADYVLYGHFYETNCKNGKTTTGIHRIIKMKNEFKLPCQEKINRHYNSVTCLKDL